jgi:prophage DNA circulation protein
MSDLGRALQTAGTVDTIDNSGESWLNSSWWRQLQPGSWRGVGFVLDAGETAAGRRIAMHEYPYRDTVWPEDIGRLPRRFAVQAYIVGDDVYQQRDRMIAACEKPGPGTLVHPTMGSVQCVLIEPLRVTDRRERGRVVELQFLFVQASDVLYPTAVVATGQNIDDSADALAAASAADLSRVVSRADPTLIPFSTTAFVADYAGLSVDAVNDAMRSLNAVTGLQGLFGRYSTGHRSTRLPATATVASALADSITTRQAVLDAADALIAAAGAL